ncbi:unnamed protein product [Symbiodinium sp. CCMP2592]|nr:unnamed protein product [Symbiodinium sp. CCMP2592]
MDSVNLIPDALFVYAVASAIRDVLISLHPDLAREMGATWSVLRSAVLGLYGVYRYGPDKRTDRAVFDPRLWDSMQDVEELLERANLAAVLQPNRPMTFRERCQVAWGHNLHASSRALLEMLHIALPLLESFEKRITADSQLFLFCAELRSVLEDSWLLLLGMEHVPTEKSSSASAAA